MRRFWEVRRRVRERLGAVVGVCAFVAALEFAVLAPLGALLLRLFLSGTGRASAGNFEIAGFLLTWTGVGALLVLGALALAGAYLRIALLLRVLGEPSVTGFEAVRGLLWKGHRMLRLGLLQVGAFVAVGAPLVLGMVLAVKGIWGDRDLNGLLVLKPPVFWYGLAAAAVPALLLAFLWIRLLLRWLFAIPILLEERGTLPLFALRKSAEQTRGRHLVHLRALAGWALAVVVASAVCQAVLAVLGRWLLDRAGSATAPALAVTACVVAAWVMQALWISWMASAFLAGLVDRLHREATGRSPASGRPEGDRAPQRLRWALGISLGVLLAGAAALGWWLMASQHLAGRVEITAHRMGAESAPENTLAALRQAIAEGADWAELDVQTTSDGGLVILHDFDLVRIGGPAKQVADATLEEIRAIDVGTGLGMPAFRGERVPTLEEVIAVAGDRIRLNIELKPPTPAAVAPLTDAVVAVVRRAGLVGRCHLCSQSYEAMRRAKAAEPGLRVGYIAGAAVGDLSRLDVDFLMVNASMVTPWFVHQAHARGIEVHPWTINDPDAILLLLDRGADNVITDAPARIRQRLREIGDMRPAERLLLRVRNALLD